MHPRHAAFARFLAGEAAIFERLAQLPNDYLIFHDRNLHPPRAYNPRVRNVDFLVLNPSYGILLLVIERGVVRPLEGRLVRAEPDGSACPVDPHRRLREAGEDLAAALASWGLPPLPMRGLVLLPDTDPRPLTGSIDGAIFAGEVDRIEMLLPMLFNAPPKPPSGWLDDIVPALTKATDGYGEPAPVPPPSSWSSSPSPAVPPAPLPAAAASAWVPPDASAPQAWTSPFGGVASFGGNTAPSAAWPSATTPPEPPRVRPPGPSLEPDPDGVRSERKPIAGVTFLGEAGAVAAVEGGPKSSSRAASSREIRTALRHGHPGSRQVKYRRTRFMNTDPELHRLRADVEFHLGGAYADPARAREAIERRMAKGTEPPRIPILMMNSPREFGLQARGAARVDYPKLETALQLLAGRRRELEQEAKRLFPMTVAI